MLTKKSTQEVVIVVLSDSSMMCLSSVIDPLRAANRLSRLPLFKWKIVSLDGNPIRLTCDIEIAADEALATHDRGDLLFVVAGFDHDLHLTKKHLKTLNHIAPKF